MNLWSSFRVPSSEVKRESVGAPSPGMYLPVRTPWANGDQQICPKPSSSLVGTTSSSMTRHSIEYWGWFEIRPIPRSLASLAPARISSSPFGNSDVKCFAGPDDVRKCLHRLLKRRFIVVAVGLVKVNVIRTEPAQGSVD